MNSIRIKCVLAFSLMALLILSNLQAPSVLLNRDELSTSYGTGFWDDPCTWDGFLVGGGLVLCGAGNLGGCATALYALTRASKVDRCF